MKRACAWLGLRLLGMAGWDVVRAGKSQMVQVQIEAGEAAAIAPGTRVNEYDWTSGKVTKLTQRIAGGAVLGTTEHGG